MTALMVLACLIGPLLVLDIAALLWGADSRDGPRSSEWERRQHWLNH